MKNRRKARSLQRLRERSKATAEVEFEGGSLGSQTLEVALVEEGGDWKLDQIEGFANYDGQTSGEAFEKKFEENPEEPEQEQGNCIAEGIAEVEQDRSRRTVLQRLARTDRRTGRRLPA